MEHTYEIRRGGDVLMHTTDKSCWYPAEILADMQAGGLELYIDGKRTQIRKRKGAVEDADQ